MKLFAIYIGGKTETSLIELHDMRFAVGKKIEDTYDDIRRSWWGTKGSLHIDCFGALEYADGYDIELKTEPSKSAEKLFFVNLGGYKLDEFTEQHKNVFVVATNEAVAKDRALQQAKDWAMPHKDSLCEVEQIVCLDKLPLLGDQVYYIHLRKADQPKEFKFKCGFWRLT